METVTLESFAGGAHRRRHRPCRGRRRAGAEEGSAAVEAVVVIPAVMVILLVVVQLALWAHAAQVTQLAASEGDRLARAQGGSLASGAARAQSIEQSPSSGLSSVQISTYVDPGDVVRIGVSGSVISVLPGPTLSVFASQSAPLQEFRQSG